MTKRFTLLVLFLGATLHAQQGYVVVVQKANATASVTRAQLRRMLMGEASTWPSGEKALVFLGPAGNPGRVAALKEICGMTESDYSKHALQVSFDGGGKPVPKSLPSDSAVKQIVQLTKGAVGIVEASAVDASMKVLSIQ